GYDAPPTVTITGDGSGASAIANTFNPQGQQVTDLDQACLRVHLNLTAAASATIRGSQDAVHQATLNAGATAGIVQHRLFDVTQPMSYQASENGTVVESGTQASRAWLDVGDSRWGL